jgi:mRNA interferase RelE/StbE
MYEIKFQPRALQDLERLDRAVVTRVLAKIHWLAENFDSIKPEALTGEFSGLFKLRVGDYRVVYEAHREKNVLEIHFAGHRREVYQ